MLLEDNLSLLLLFKAQEISVRDNQLMEAERMLENLQHLVRTEVGLVQ